MTTARVFIVDDHPLVRRGIATLISQQDDMSVCGEAAGAAEAIAAMVQDEPDVAVVDLTLAEGSGLELLKDIAARLPRVKTLILSMRDEGFYAERALRAGARGYVTKEENPKKMIEAIRKVLAGNIHVSEAMATKLMGALVGGGGAPGEATANDLTDRELEVFERIGAGQATREIAAALHISVKTVESHRENIKQKLRIDTAAALTKHAIEWVNCRQDA